MYRYLDDAIYEGLVLEQPRSVENNIRRGSNALRRVMISHSPELMAMFRKELGWIGFEWGTEGEAPPEFKDHEEFRQWQKTGRKPYDMGGHGIAHIIAKRDWEGKHIQQFKGQKGADLIEKIVEAIAKGAVKIKGLKAVIIWQGMEIALAKKGNKSAPYWLLTGYVKPTQGYTYILESAGEWGGVDDPARAPTHIRPTLYRPYVGAANSNKILESADSMAVKSAPFKNPDLWSSDRFTMPTIPPPFGPRQRMGAANSSEIINSIDESVNTGWLYDL